MRVLHLADRLTDRGGSYRHLLAVLEALAPAHDLALAVGADDGVARAPCPVHVVPGLEARGAAAVDLDRLVAEVRPDLVHAHNLTNPVALDAVARQPRALLTVQDHRVFCPTRGKWRTDGRVCREAMAIETCAGCFEDPAYFRDVYALTAARLDAVRRLSLTVLSHYMKAELVAVGMPAAAVHVIPPFVHGLDPEATPDGPPCVLFVGRLVEAKGVHDAVRAWRRSGLDLPLVFAGTGPLRERLAAEGLTVLGWVAHEGLSRVYRRARAVLLPSRWQEPFGMVGLESLTMGVPVVAWDTGGVREWHPGAGLVSWGDVDGLAAALRQAVSAPGPVRPPAGFEREGVISRLVEVYATLA